MSIQPTPEVTVQTLGRRADGSTADHASAERSLVGIVVLAIGVGLFAASSIRATLGMSKAFGVPFFDWTFYSAAVQRWLAGEPIYPDGRISTLGAAAGSSYAYPPASVPLMLPFAPWPLGAILWEAVIIGLFLLGVWTVVRRGWPTHATAAFGIALAALSQVEGVTQGIALGNVNIATAGALGLVWAGLRDPAPLAGILGVIKVFPIAIAAPAGVRVLARAGVIALAICVVTLPLVGIQSWVDYISGLRAVVPLCGDATFVNYSLACQVTPVIGAGAAQWAGLVVAAVLVLVAIRAGLTVVGMAATAFAIIVPATEVHQHYVALLAVVVLIGFASLNLWRLKRAAMVMSADGTAGSRSNDPAVR